MTEPRTHHLTAIGFDAQAPTLLAGHANGDVTRHSAPLGTLPWDRARQPPDLDEEDASVTALSSIGNGQRIVLARAHGQVELWSDLPTAHPGEFNVQRHDTGRRWVQACNSSQWAFLGVDTGFRVFGLRCDRHGQARQGETIAALDIDGVRSVDAIGVSDEALVLLSGFKYHVVAVDGSEPIRSAKPVNASQFDYTDGLVGLSRNGRYYFVHWDDVSVFDTRTGQQTDTYPIVHGACCAAMDDQGQRLVIGTRHGRVVVMGHGGRIVWQQDVGELAIDKVAISADGRRIAFFDRGTATGLIDIG